MNFSKVSSRTIIGKLLRLPLRLIPDNTVLPIMQGTLRGKRWIVGSSNHGCWLGSYELDKQKQFVEHIRPNQVVYDLGAHVGFYTLLASEIVGSDGRVISFEPLPDNIKYLKEHISLNQLSNVTLFPYAVADHYETATFHVSKSHYQGSLAPVSSSEGEPIQVQVIALDRFIQEQDLPTPQVIKVDIEGAEYKFLLGARKLLESNEVTLFIATHGMEVHHKCLELLHDIGYSVKSLTGEDLETSKEIIAHPRLG